MQQEIIRILLVDDKVELRQNIRRLLSFEDAIEIVGEASNGQEAIEAARKTRPDLILMDINMPVMDGIQSTEFISLEMPEITIIMMSVQGEQEYIRKAMKAGARDFLVKPFSNDDLIDTIKSVYRADMRRRTMHQPAPGNPAQAAPVQQGGGGGPVEGRQGEIVTVFSTKGGVGKTTIVLNLAIALKKLTGKRICVVDCDLQFGDVAIMLNLAPQKTLTNLVEEPPPWTPELVEEYVTHHDISGIDVLLGPSKPEYAETVQGEHIEQALTLLKERYDYVFVDTSPMFRNIELSILDLSAIILVVVSLELSAIKNIKLCLELLNNLNYNPEKIKLILNRGYPPMGGIEVNDVQNGLRREVISLIPSAGKEVVSSLNKGTPFMLTDSSSDLAKSFYKLAELVVAETGGQLPGAPAQGEKKEASNLFGRFTGIFSSSS
jgi:pilus assembly protein CpaE